MNQPLDQPNDIRIRPVAESDVVPYRELRLEALRLHPDAFSSDYAQQQQYPPTFWNERIHKAIGNPELIIFVAETDQGLVGMTGIGRGDSPKTAHTAWVWGVYVRAEYRGRRLGRMLLEACQDWARSSGVRIIKLGVAVNNTGALRCYTRCGYEVYGTEPQAISWQGQDYDEHLMALKL
ncbi:MAG TPA: GNAT family N-acetyltransferase [Candidatus Obscuribacterales bacterium]